MDNYIQDFDENRNFSLPKDESGILTVVWRNSSDENSVHTFEITYEMGNCYN